MNTRSHQAWRYHAVLRGACLALGCACLALGCDLGQTVQNTSDKAIAAIEGAISALERQSGAWQETLKKLEGDLVAQGQSTLSNEVQNLASRGIATGGVELRCNADFVGVRMRQGLARLVAKLRQQTEPPITPAFCQVVPTTIDLELRPTRLKEVDFYGYDLDAHSESAVKVSVQDSNGTEVVVPGSKLATPTHYMMTINVSSTNGVSFTPQSQKVIIRAGRQVLSTLNVIQPPAPTPCGGSGQRCCGPDDHKAACGSNLDCSGGTCVAPPCGGSGQPVCPGGGCKGGFSNIEGTCKQVTQLESTSEGCGEDVMRWVSTSGMKSIHKGQTVAFYVQKGGNLVWHCGTDNTNDRTGCPGDTNYVTVSRESGGRTARVVCSLVVP